MTQPIEPVANFAQFCGEWRETESASGQPLYTASALEAAKQEGRREGLEEARGLRADALEIFNGPECPQIVRDAIEWYAASVECLIEKGSQT